MKRLFTIVLALIMCLSLVACSSSDSSSDSSSKTSANSDIHTFSGITKIEVRRNDTPEYLDVTSDELSKKLSEFVEYLSTLEPASPPENEDSPAGSYVDVKVYDSKGTHQLYFPYTGSNRVNYKVCMSDGYTFADDGKIEEIADYLKDVCGEAAK